MYTPKYFSAADFICCQPKCSMSDLNEALIRKLDSARKHSGVPFVLNSAYRSAKWEIEHKRTGTSSHTKGLAVDISTPTPLIRLKVLYGLIQAGFTRIGIAGTFIHADIDSSKPDCVWTY